MPIEVGVAEGDVIHYKGTECMVVKVDRDRKYVALATAVPYEEVERKKKNQKKTT